MSNFAEIFPSPNAIVPIAHGQKVVQLGSCFSTHITQKLRYAGFSVEDNPFGVIFHPLVIAEHIQQALSGEIVKKTVQKDDVFLDYRASGSVYGMTQKALEDALSQRFLHLKEALLTADYLMVTFGSALGYYLKETNELVANCHQQPAVLFDKKVIEVDEMTRIWKETIHQLKLVNPRLQVVLTVSPVRYSREGWVENNRSKARLLLVCEELTAVGTYFPSYELVNDLLRDYRYFEADGVHPNELAITEVWHLFQAWFFTKETQAVCAEIAKIRTMEAHRFLYPESVKVSQFQEKTNQLKRALLLKNPLISW